MTHQNTFVLANPHEKYQVADVILNPNLTRRRLVFAGGDHDRWFVHYERGGRGVTCFIALFVIGSDGQAHVVWSGSGSNRADNLDQLRKMVAAGEFLGVGEY